MGNSSAKQHEKDASIKKRNQASPKRRSIRKSLRLSRSGSRDVLSHAERYLQNLSDDIGKGKIYHMKLEQLKEIDTDLNKILQDLQNFGEIDNTNPKRFELENTAKYLRNKIKSATDSHMDNAIQRLNESAEISNAVQVGSQDTPESIQNLIITEPYLETSKQKVAAKLRELLIKTKEVYNLLSSMNEIDEVTKTSALAAIDKCKYELYNLETRNEKLVNKKWKCFRKIDEIRYLLEYKGTDIKDDAVKRLTFTVAAEVNMQDARNDADDPTTDENDGDDADVEDNTGKLSSNSNVTVQSSEGIGETRTSGESKEKSSNDHANYRVIKEVKLNVNKIQSFVLSLDNVDELTKKSTEETLNKYKQNLRDLKVHSANLVKKRIRCIKKIESVIAILHEKYCGGSDVECNCCSSLVSSEKEQMSVETQAVAEMCNEATKGNNPESKQQCKIETEPQDLTKRLSDNFEMTRKKIDEIFYRKSASFEDFEDLSHGIDELNKQFDSILRKVCHIHEDKNEESKVYNHCFEERNIQTSETKNTNFPKETIADKGITENIVMVHPATENLNDNSKIREERRLTSVTNSAATENKSADSAHLRNPPDVITGTTENQSKSSDNLQEAFLQFRDPPDSKKYKPTHSVDQLCKLNQDRPIIQRLSQQNLTRMEKNSDEGFISMRNIDLSQITNSSIASLNCVGGSKADKTISARNIDLSQVVFRDSDYPEVETIAAGAYDSDADSSLNIININESNNEGNSYAKYGSSNPNPNDINQNISNREYHTSSVSKQTENKQIEQGIPLVESPRYKLKEAETRLDIAKEKIMNFVGIKTDDFYNELDEELVAIMIILDNLKLDKDDDFYNKRQDLVSQVYKFSNILERKTLDHQYLDAFDKELIFVEKEMKQSLAKENMENLKNILGDIEDMRTEIEEKILDHLLVGRREGCIQKLDSFKKKLSVFIK